MPEYEVEVTAMFKVTAPNVVKAYDVASKNVKVIGCVSGGCSTKKERFWYYVITKSSTKISLPRKLG